MEAEVLPCALAIKEAGKHNNKTPDYDTTTTTRVGSSPPAATEQTQQ
jgi:hypothetical protein